MYYICTRHIEVFVEENGEMFKSFYLIEFILPWIWLVLSIMFYLKQKTKPRMLIVISLLIIPISDVISYNIQFLFVGLRSEKEVQDIIYFFLSLGSALHVFGMLLLTGGAYWLVRSELWSTEDTRELPR